MNTKRNAGKSARDPFKDDLSYIMREWDWVKARSARIGAERDGTNPPALPWSRRRAGLPDLAAHCDCKIKSLKKVEDRLRQDIEARLARNREVGPELGLDCLCKQHGLLDFERTILLIGALPVVGNIMAGFHLDGASSIGISGSIDVEVVWDFLELDATARVKSLVTLLPESSLTKNGLVSYGYVLATPGDMARSGFEVTGKALAVLTGIPEFASLSRQFESRGEDD